MNSLKIIPLSEKEKWNQIVKSFHSHDVYFLNEYVSACQKACNDSFFLIYFCGNIMRLCYTIQQSDISQFEKFNGILEPDTCFDWSTPYGYGGPLVENFSIPEMNEFMQQISDYCSSNKIACQFIRFHPLLDNHRFFSGCSDIVSLKKTVYIDTVDSQTIFKNMDPKNRNMVRKAIKNGIEIKTDTNKQFQTAFYSLYKSTMERKHASDFYFFNNKYFEYIFQNLNDHFSLFSACYKNEIISSAIILYCNGRMHYHLSASNPDFKHLAPNNLLLYTAACQGADNGYTTFHLGGGIEPQDSLFAFKRSFHRAGLKDFYIGRTIFCNDTYQKLLQIRLSNESDFIVSNHRLIQYRT